MRIALCHDALIPPPDYGGTERVIVWLARALVELGHQVTLVARPGSALPGTRFVPLRPGVPWDELVPADVELLHLWAPPNPAPRRPFLVTIGGNGQPGEVFERNTVFVSRKHAENHGSVNFVHNGLDPSELPCDSDRKDHFVFLAKASWSVKNLDGAVAIARAAGVRLEVLGSRSLPGKLHRWIPRIRGVRYHGMVGDAEKREVLRNARGLLFPVRWHEPFGIAITEALASGCPVFGTPYGSLPEIITPEVGVMSHEAALLVKGVRRALEGAYRPEICRSRVFEGFTADAMARKYLQYYAQVLNQGGLEGGKPRTRVGFKSQELLPWAAL